MNITGGIYNGRKLLTPDEKIARPTLSKIRMSVFNTLYSILGDYADKTFLDMFGGSGIMGLEAISRGFKDTVVFEKNKKAAEIIKQNYQSLNLVPNIHIGDALNLYQKLDTNFDVIYIDPPYNSGIYDKVLGLIQQKPTADTLIIVEHDNIIDFKNYKIIKQKKYGNNYITFIEQS